MSRSSGFFDPRHDDSAELIDAGIEAYEDEQDEETRPGQANSDAARRARAAREQRKQQGEEEEAAIQDPRLRALAAAIPPPPPPMTPRTYSPADGVDGAGSGSTDNGNASGNAGSPTAPVGPGHDEEQIPAAAGTATVAGADTWGTASRRHLPAPPPPPPCAPPLDAGTGWRAVRRDE